MNDEVRDSGEFGADQQPTPAQNSDIADPGGESGARAAGAGPDDVTTARPDNEVQVTDEVGLLRRRVEELEAENSDLKDQYLRKTADFENYRKRMLREKEEFGQYANRQLLLDIVPIIDDFERAIKSADESKDFDAFHDGVALIEKQFTSMLERKWGLQRFDSVGEEFDPQKHEALTTEELPESDTPTVVEDYQKGYMLHDKVLRSAKVKVALPSSQTT